MFLKAYVRDSAFSKYLKILTPFFRVIIAICVFCLHLFLLCCLWSFVYMFIIFYAGVCCYIKTLTADYEITPIPMLSLSYTHILYSYKKIKLVGFWLVF